jgi:hypothetical protein
VGSSSSTYAAVPSCGSPSKITSGNSKQLESA